MYASNVVWRNWIEYDLVVGFKFK